MRHVFVLFLLLFSSLSAQDSIEEFWGNRFSQQPPTEQEELIVVQSVKSFFDRLNTHDISEAYYINTSKQFQGTTSFENFQLFIQNLIGIDFKQKLDKHNVTFTTNDKSKATYSILLNGKKKGQRFYVEFSLERQDDDWKIMSIKIYAISYSGS